MIKIRSPAVYSSDGFILGPRRQIDHTIIVSCSAVSVIGNGRFRSVFDIRLERVHTF